LRVLDCRYVTPRVQANVRLTAKTRAYAGYNLEHDTMPVDPFLHAERGGRERAGGSWLIYPCEHEGRVYVRVLLWVG
jgi:hypothetical protein